MIICACMNASNNCYKICAKGRLLKPERVYTVNWPRVVSRDMENKIRAIDLNDLEK